MSKKKKTRFWAVDFEGRDLECFEVEGEEECVCKIGKKTKKLKIGELEFEPIELEEIPP